MKVAIIGAGASGLMCAGFLNKAGHEVLVFDGNEKAGKKLYITGKGRCNFTNASFGDDFSENIVRGEKFLKSALSNWNSFDTIEFFESLGVKTKIERGNRAFPASDKASDITKALLRHCEGVTFHYNEKIISVNKDEEKFKLKTEKDVFIVDRLIVASGGKSYEATGSTGDGYKFAKKFGHNIIDLKPALVPIKLKNKFIAGLEGLSLKNVRLNAVSDGRKISEFGEMMFTDCGITGPIVLKISSRINRDEKVGLSIDFKPALSEEKLNERILREFEGAKNKSISNILKNLLPNSLIKPFLERCLIDEKKKVNSITILERKKIIDSLKNFKLEYNGLYDINCAVVTSGGVDLKEINPKTMESKIVKGLYFIGEVLDIDAFTGGFNLQIAFSTAVQCARSFS